MLCLVVRCNKLETVVEPPISKHAKCEDLVVAYGRWSLTRTEPHGVSSEKVPTYLPFGREFIACDFLLVTCTFLSSMLSQYIQRIKGPHHTSSCPLITRGMENYKTVRWWFTRGSSDYKALTGKILVLNTEVPLQFYLNFFLFGTLVVKLKQDKVLVLISLEELRSGKWSDKEFLLSIIPSKLK